MSPPEAETWEDGALCRLNDSYLPLYTTLYHNCSEILESTFPARFTCSREGIARLIPKFPAACRAKEEPAREEQEEALRVVEGLLLKTAAERAAGAQEVMERFARADPQNVRFAIFSLRRGIIVQHLSCLLQVREGLRWRSSSACLRFSPGYRSGAWASPSACWGASPSARPALLNTPCAVGRHFEERFSRSCRCP